MAEVRSKRPGELNPQLAKLVADASAMREQINKLEARVLRLETELASARKPSKRPPPHVGPPPLPRQSVIPKASRRRSVVDISEIAELVESMPPPPPRPTSK